MQRIANLKKILQSPKPSMHDINVGWYKPGSIEASANIIPGFGATINVINGGLECNKGQETAQVENRIKYYRYIAAMMDVPFTEAELTCKNMGPFPTNGVAAIDLYWDQDWQVPCKCKQVCTLYNTIYTLNNIIGW